MKKHLLDILFASEKRKNTLIFLRDGPKDMEQILDFLRTTRTSLLPQIRILEEHHLVKSINSHYELTIIGKILVDKFKPFLSLVELFNEFNDYWGTHKLDFVPPHLLERLDELGSCTDVQMTLHESYQLNQDVIKTTFMSDSFFVVTSFFHPDYPKVFSDMVQKDVNIHIIVSEDLLKTIR